MFLLALSANDGNVTRACEYTGVSRKEYNQWMITDPEFIAGVEEVAEEILDLAEGVIIGAMRDRNLTAAIYYTKCKGKHRGYVERGTPDEGKVPITFNMNFNVTPKRQQIGEGEVMEIKYEEE